MSRVGHLLTQSRAGQKMGDVVATDMMIGALTDPFGNGHMGVTAENIAKKLGIDRISQDTFARDSSQGRCSDFRRPVQGTDPPYDREIRTDREDLRS